MHFYVCTYYVLQKATLTIQPTMTLSDDNWGQASFQGQSIFTTNPVSPSTISQYHQTLLVFRHTAGTPNVASSFNHLSYSPFSSNKGLIQWQKIWHINTQDMNESKISIKFFGEVIVQVLNNVSLIQSY